MAIRMSELFHRRTTTSSSRRPDISLRRQLARHRGGRDLSLRDAAGRFTQFDSGDGFRNGCRPPDDLRIGFPVDRDLGGILPAWVSANRRTPGADPELADSESPRSLEGVVLETRITREDFPLQPWHTFYDWNFFVHVDQQYKYLLSEVTATHHSEKFDPTTIGGKVAPIIECEWDSQFVPLWAVPQRHSRVWIHGRWIYDCGHPENGRHRTEIHPPKLLVSFRSEAARLQGNSGATQAELAVVYIGRKGGYINQPINDEDYEFDLPLPPRPDPLAVPRTSVRAMIQPLPVQPRLVPFPSHDPHLVRVTIPLRGVEPHPDEYGAIIAAGWSDPSGVEVQKVRRFRVSLSRLEKKGRIDPLTGVGVRNLDWLVFFSINGRWHRRRLKEIENDLDIAEVIELHQEDAIQIFVCGFAILTIFDFMGEPSGVPPRLVTRGFADPDERQDAAEKIRARFASLIVDHGKPSGDGNLHIQLFCKVHPSSNFKPVESFEEDSKKNTSAIVERGDPDVMLPNVGNNYVMHYTVEQI